MASYFILRNGQQYGPYSEIDLLRYLRTGDVYPGDLSRTGKMKEWLPVTEVLGTPAPPMPATDSGPENPLAGSDLISARQISAVRPGTARVPLPPRHLAAVPMPPRLHWGVLALLVLVTFGLFSWIWAFVLANWARKIDPRSRSTSVLGTGFMLSLASIALYAALGTAKFASILAFALLAAGLALYFIGLFQLRNSIIAHYGPVEGIPLSLSAVMTFFFNVIYLQFKFNQTAKQPDVESFVEDSETTH